LITSIVATSISVLYKEPFVTSNTTPVSSLNSSCKKAKELYLTANPDVKTSGMDPWYHYITYGKKEGRKWVGNNCRFVTILYSVWFNHMMKNNKAIQMQKDCPSKCGGGYHWWGKPAYKNGDINEYRFVKSDGKPNVELIDYHADLLYSAGIDFISIDLSNGEQPLIIESAQAVIQRYSERPLETTPRIALFVLNEKSVEFMRNKFYNNPSYKNVWFMYEDKPLILVANTNGNNPIPNISGFTCRRCWGLLSNDNNAWTFKQNTTVPGQLHVPFVNPHNQDVEQMSASVAVQESYISDPKTRRVGRDNGLYFNNQWRNILKYKPTFVFVTAWNEWGAENQRTPPDYAFVDAYGQEFSSDIEPMSGGHTTNYYDLLKQWIMQYKLS
jgi:hypothetical protein